MTTTSAAASSCATGRLEPEAAGVRLSELFAKHGATVLGLCRVLLRHREEAEDAVQQTFLSAYRSLLTGVEPRYPAAWLATIARNECRSRIEARMREPLGDGEPLSTLPDPVAAAAAKADLTELWRAIGELPRRQRRALLLREFSGLTYLELASTLAISEPAVESLLFRARRELRLRLKPAYSSVAGLAPLHAIRDALARAVGGMPDPTTTGLLAKIGSAPLVAKLTAGAAVVVVAGGTVEAIENGSLRGPGLAHAESFVQPAQGADLRARELRSTVGDAVLAAKPRRAPTGSIRARGLRPEPALAPVTSTTGTPRPEATQEPATALADDPVQGETPAPAPVVPPTAPAAPTFSEETGTDDEASSSSPGSDDQGEPASDSDDDGSGSGGPDDDDSGSSGDEGAGSSGTDDGSGTVSGGGGSGESGSDDDASSSGAAGSGEDDPAADVEGGGDGGGDD